MYNISIIKKYTKKYRTSTEQWLIRYEIVLNNYCFCLKLFFCLQDSTILYVYNTMPSKCTLFTRSRVFNAICVSLFNWHLIWRLFTSSIVYWSRDYNLLFLMSISAVRETKIKRLMCIVYFELVGLFLNNRISLFTFLIVLQHFNVKSRLGIYQSKAFVSIMIWLHLMISFNLIMPKTTGNLVCISIPLVI